MGQRRELNLDFGHLFDDDREKFLPSKPTQDILSDCSSDTRYPRLRELFKTCPTTEMRDTLIEKILESHTREQRWIHDLESAHWIEQIIFDLRTGFDDRWEKLLKFYLENSFFNNGHEWLDYSSVRAIEFAILLYRKDAAYFAPKALRILFNALKEARAKTLLYWHTPSLRLVLIESIEELFPKDKRYDGYRSKGWDQALRAIKLIADMEDGTVLPLLRELHEGMNDGSIYLHIYRHKTWITNSIEDDHKNTVKRCLEFLEKQHQQDLAAQVATYLNSRISNGVVVELSYPTWPVPVGETATIKFEIKTSTDHQEKLRELLKSLVLHVWDNARSYELPEDIESNNNSWRFDDNAVLEVPITRKTAGIATVTMNFDRQKKLDMDEKSQKIYIDFAVPEGPELPPESPKED